MDALAAKIKISRAGLRDVEKPIGCFVFSGPTGVGKTELAKQLAETMGLKMQRFDMSEYMEKHAVARLIGAPPGYVGHDQGGLLTDAIDKHPYTVLLLDEIEKAHPDIYNLLLQVMDNGKLTDTHGKEVNFRNVVLIMTTNAGAADMQKASMGLGQKDGLQKDADIAAINKLFTPEFRNRLDGVIRFSPLKPTTMGRIVDKFIGKLSKQLKEQGVTIELTQAARDHLAEIGYDERMGARPMARVIEKQIKEPLSEEILGGRLQDGGSVKIDFNAEAAIPAEDGEETKPRLTFSFNSKSAAKAVAGPSKAPRAPFPG